MASLGNSFTLICLPTRSNIWQHVLFHNQWEMRISSMTYATEEAWTSSWFLVRHVHQIMIQKPHLIFVQHSFGTAERAIRSSDGVITVVADHLVWHNYFSSERNLFNTVQRPLPVFYIMLLFHTCKGCSLCRPLVSMTSSSVCNILNFTFTVRLMTMENIPSSMSCLS